MTEGAAAAGEPGLGADDALHAMLHMQEQRFWQINGYITCSVRRGPCRLSGGAKRPCNVFVADF